MKLKNFYQEIVRLGMSADVRSSSELTAILKQEQKVFSGLSAKEKEFFDQERLTNPFSDTRIIHGDLNLEVKTAIVGVDVDTAELLLADHLKSKGNKLDLVISHHPLGQAYAQFYQVMDLQIDIYSKQGLSLSFAEQSLKERKQEVERRVHAANHNKAVDAARLLDLAVLCMHTPCDNFANQYMQKLLSKEKPKTLGQVKDLLYTIPEYIFSAKKNNPPLIALGNESSRVANIHLEFTGGTEGPANVYEKLALAGIDTIIAMHQSEEHYKQCRAAKLNVIFAAHIASDNLGINLMLDQLQTKQKLNIYEFSGFRRVERKSK